MRATYLTMLGLLGAMALPAPLLADPVPPVAAIAPLSEAARVTAMADIVSREIRRDARDMEASLFPGKGGAAWIGELAALTAPERIEASLTAAIAREMSPSDIAEARMFFDGPAGRRILAADLTTRERLLAPAHQDVAIAAARMMRDSGHARLGRIDALIAAGDLLEGSVTTGLNTTYHFYRGMQDAGAEIGVEGEAGLLGLALARQDAIRTETEDWLYAHLLAATTRLPDGDLDAYLAFQTSRAGRSFNRALTEGLSEGFKDLAYDLGRLVARTMAQQDA